MRVDIICADFIYIRRNTFKLNFGYEAYYKDCYTLDTGVKNVKFRNYNVTDVPDVAYRSRAGILFNSTQENDDVMFAYRMRALDSLEEMLLPIYSKMGDSTSASNKIHNSAYYIPSSGYPDDPEFFAGNGQLCYTAHGNSEKLEKMIDICAQKIEQSLRWYTKENYPYMNTAHLGIEDNIPTCGCDSCLAVKRAHNNADSAAVLMFVNCVGEKVMEWMNKPENAQLLSVKQCGEEIEFEPDKITGKLKFAGKDTEPIEVQTTKDGFLFKNIFGYDAALTARNIVSELMLNGKNDKYYVLNSDVGSASAPISFVRQTEASATVNFAGTFDGRGHTLYAKTGKHGIFGGFGLGAVVKNTKFVITFDKSSGKACGLAGNGDVYESRLFRADSQLENLYIEATNFSDNTFAISTIRRMGMKLKDVFVNLGDTSAVSDFDGRNNVAALFNVDYTWNNIMVNEKVDLAEMENVRVVSGKVMPIGNGYAWEGSGPFSAVKGYDGWEDYGGYSWYVNFAKNDVDLFGSVNHSGADGSVPYTRITLTDSTNHQDWFKWICINYITDFVGEKCITVYYGGIDVADGGIIGLLLPLST